MDLDLDDRREGARGGEGLRTDGSEGADTSAGGTATGKHGGESGARGTEGCIGSGGKGGEVLFFRDRRGVGAGGRCFSRSADGGGG